MAERRSFSIRLSSNPKIHPVSQGPTSRDFKTAQLVKVPATKPGELSSAPETPYPMVEGENSVPKVAL